jgi:hypothetical protein
MLQGAFFHKLVQQYYSGLPKELVSKQVKEEPVYTWWTNFLVSSPAEGAKIIFPEKILAIKFHGFQMIAKYDLITVQEDESLVIYDWKTSYNKPPREYLAARLQTRIYPLLLSKAMGNLLKGKKPEPENIKMVYWYANQPDSIEKFSFLPAKMKSDEKYLLELIKDIVSLETIDQFPLTQDVNHCQYCVYRSLCDRGDVAGDISAYIGEFGFDDDFDIDLEQIEEIKF